MSFNVKGSPSWAEYVRRGAAMLSAPLAKEAWKQADGTRAEVKAVDADLGLALHLHRAREAVGRGAAAGAATTIEEHLKNKQSAQTPEQKKAAEEKLRELAKLAEADAAARDKKRAQVGATVSATARSGAPGKPTVISGRLAGAEPDSTVTVTVGDRAVAAKVGGDGSFQVELILPKGQHPMTVRAKVGEHSRVATVEANVSDRCSAATAKDLGTVTYRRYADDPGPYSASLEPDGCYKLRVANRCAHSVGIGLDQRADFKWMNLELLDADGAKVGSTTVIDHQREISWTNYRGNFKDSLWRKVEDAGEVHSMGCVPDVVVFRIEKICYRAGPNEVTCDRKSSLPARFDFHGVRP